MSGDKKDKLPALVDGLVKTCADGIAVNHAEGHDLPDRASVAAVLDLLLEIIFPGYSHGRAVTLRSLPYYFGDLLHRLQRDLLGQVERAFAYDCRQRHDPHCQACRMAEQAVSRLLDRLPAIREILKKDMLAAFARDPAAESVDLILFCYPGMEAIATQRLAHELYAMGVPIIPRMWTERAHSRTGIDIHPGAEIGVSFFIDHGTGVVIGETTVIGENVTIYQGVTLGALKPAKGRSLRGEKRHPTIEDDVTIYSGATVLGGETIIGAGSVIGGNVWLTESLPAGTVVTMGKNELSFSRRKKG